MKDKTEKETTTKKAKTRSDSLNDFRQKLAYFEDSWYRVGVIEDRMKEFTDCCSTILTRLTDQGIIITELRKNSDMCMEMVAFNKKELDHLRHSTLDFVKHVDNIEQKTIASISNQNDKLEQLSNSHGAQYTLIGHRIDRLYQELQVLVNAKGLDINMKNIVDGLEETVHELEEKCERKYDELRNSTYSNTVMIWGEVGKISRSLQLLNKLMIPCFTMALVAFIWTIINIIKAMFF